MNTGQKQKIFRAKGVKPNVFREKLLQQMCLPRMCLGQMSLRQMHLEQRSIEQESFKQSLVDQIMFYSCRKVICYQKNDIETKLFISKMIFIRVIG